MSTCQHGTPGGDLCTPCGRPGRADGFSETQSRQWCSCSAEEGPAEECPLHGRFIVEWGCFYPDGPKGKPQIVGVSYATDEYPTDALERAEYECADIQREIPGTFLRYRLIDEWRQACD